MSIDSWLASKLRMWEDDAEHFLGEELDPRRMETLDRVHALCRRLVEMEPSISLPFMPFTNRSKNALVQLLFPAPFFMFGGETMHLLGQIIALADDVTLAATGDGRIAVTCGIENMWSRWGYDNDLEHGQ